MELRSGRTVGVAAARADRVFGDQHARALGEAELDPALEAKVAEVGGAEIPDGGDSAQQRAARVDPRLQRLLGRKLHDLLDEGLGEIVL